MSIAASDGLHWNGGNLDEHTWLVVMVVGVVVLVVVVVVKVALAPRLPDREREPGEDDPPSVVTPVSFAPVLHADP